MLVTEADDRANRKLAVGLSIATAIVSIVMALAFAPLVLTLPTAGLVYVIIRRRVARRVKVLAKPFRQDLEATLSRDVEFFRALDETGKRRFRDLVKVFLDEVRITGIRTDVDTETEALVAASAVIPIFGFEDWEYARLGEVLIYPGRFDDEFKTDDGVERRTLGMVGVGHLSGVMILSKPDLIAGFRNPQDKRNVGIHEFAHLVDRGDGIIDGLPPGVELSTAAPWIEWVGQELKNRPDGRHHIDDYAYTNEAEYFAVLSEYFFEAPDVLAKQAPPVYQMMERMYRQNTKSLLSTLVPRKKRVGRNSKCPCGSGKKFKKCCLRK
ncbi:MAG: zinc-dependent peptidase [Planctomycetota bacterium]